MNLLTKQYKNFAQEADRILKRYNLTLAPPDYETALRTKTLPL